ncbi:MAG: MmcQ/YjbR family DNA-binding protein [Bryobacteraceae bacterium]
MTVDDFRGLALSLPDAAESAHMGHPDFRVHGKIFATLGYPDQRFGVVLLTPEKQREFILLAPDTFEPVPGGWGLKGSTRVVLENAEEARVHEALVTAYRRVPAKKAPRKSYSREKPR